MSAIELKNELHNLIDSITDETVLQRFFNLIKTEGKSYGTLWNSLSEEQRQELLLSDEESDNPVNLISHEEMKQRHSKWL